ncbi:MAG: hypothetical protein JWO77_1102 [Ilumatobacteraceae bacterium]|nr:hypothetical protein [Ilumatobacteraceae bacterium]
MLPPLAEPDPDGLVRYKQLCEEVSVVMGAINVAAGRLVELARLAVEEGQAEGTGIRSEAHWIAWRTGLSLRHAKDVVRLANRAEQLPCCLAALTAGELTLDQAAMIAWHVPAEYEEACTEFAKIATVSQLRKALPRYGFEKPGRDDGRVTERREVSTGTDELGWWFGGRLPEDEGAEFDHAIRAKQDDLYRQRRAEAPEGSTVPPVSRADALVAMARDSLSAGQTARPGSDRYLVHVHLEAGPDGAMQLMTHLGLPLPDHQRRQILCDAALRGLVHQGLAPIGAGRTTRTINRRLRRAIEHRDGGCRTPGCGSTIGLEIHHIWHWEDGGPTETWNLVCLCSRRHREHHLGLLAVTGNPDLRPGASGTIEFRDQHHRLLHPCGTPAPPVRDAGRRPATTTPGEGAVEAARAIGLDPPHYQPPLGEPMRLSDLSFHRNEPVPVTDERTPDSALSSDPIPLDRREGSCSQRRAPATEPAGRPVTTGPPAA